MPSIIDFSRKRSIPTHVLFIVLAVFSLLGSTLTCSKIDTEDQTAELLDEIGLTRGICVLLGDADGEFALDLAEESELLIYIQLEREEDVQNVREVVYSNGLYGSRIFVEKGALTRLHLADNLVDVVVASDAEVGVAEAEVLRVLRPGGTALLGSRKTVKPVPDGVDDWSHPYHGPDNNPQSSDRIARAPYLTQFLAKPYYAPLTQVAVASAGRVFKAFGNIAFHEREEAFLNSLVAFNGYNGTMLWRRTLTPGVMIHRNTMIATPDVLFVGDDKSCKLIDTQTGEVEGEIIPPLDVAGGTFWKWMALEDGILYALVGKQEQKDLVVRQRRQVHGWPWNPLSKGFNQPENPWGYGCNLMAIDPRSKKILWSHHEEEPIDSRALCLKNGRMYLFSPGAYLTCLSTETGEEIWRKTPENDPSLYKALGDSLDRQDYRTNWRTTAYLKCSDEALYFAGPTVGKLLAVSAEDGGVLWENAYSNYQLVLREDGLYGISGQIDKHPSHRFDPLTGEVLEELETKRRACTRPNGAIDAIFYRAMGGTIRLDLASSRQQWVSPMRAQCHDGVTIANGFLYWWPSTCDCQNTLYGVTGLGPAGDFIFGQEADVVRLERGSGEVPHPSIPNGESDKDWSTFRADNKGTAKSGASISQETRRLWWSTPESRFVPTAPVTSGELVFLSGSDGIVRAMDTKTGKIRWKAFTGGSVRFPPTVWRGSLFVGSGDGWVYKYEAQTGRLIWRFRAAPEERKIPVYGALVSTWPVTSGVLIEDGVAYFAAGIVNYDGTHVYALDADSGDILWQNNTSGHLDPEARTGVSVQGHMLLNQGKLYLASGTSLSPAVFDIRNGRCLNDTTALKLCASNSSRGWELYTVGDHVLAAGMPFYGDPDYPVYDPSVRNKMLHTSSHDRDIVWINNNLLMGFDPIDKKKLNDCVADPEKKAYFINIGWGKFDIPDKPVWEYECENSVALAVCQNAVVIARNSPSGASRIEALDIRNGVGFWKGVRLLPGSLVPWGMAVDRDGRIIVTLEDGQVLGFGPPAESTAE